MSTVWLRTSIFSRTCRIQSVIHILNRILHLTLPIWINCIHGGQNCTWRATFMDTSTTQRALNFVLIFFKFEVRYSYKQECTVLFKTNTMNNLKAY